MGVVTSEIEVAAEPSAVFRLAQRVENYPAYMPDVKSVKVLERRDDGYARVAWIARAHVASIDKDIKWVEEQWWNPDTLSAKYQLLEGDYKHYGGEWTFTASAVGTKIRQRIDFDLGLPLVGALIGKLLDKIMQDNLDSMLKAIKERAESAKGCTSTAK